MGPFDLPIGREMFPVLSPPVGGLGTIGRTAVLGAMLGPGVDSTRCDLVDTGWVMRGKPGATPRVGSTDAQTASMLALPGMATELQLGREEARSGVNRGQNRMAQGSWAPSWEPGQRARVPAAGMGERVHVPCPLSGLPLPVLMLPTQP